MPDFTAYDPATRRILYDGKCEDASLLAHPAIEGVRVSGTTHRLNALLNAFEEKPWLGSSVNTTAILAGGTIEVTVPEPVYCFVDGVFVGQIIAFGAVQFSDVGEYAMELRAISDLVLPETYLISVG